MREPRNLRSLQDRINNIVKDQQRPLRRVQRVIANTVVGRMLPLGVVKGGTAMKARLGEAASRFTPDFDAARAAQLGLEEYLQQLEDNLAKGWGGFTATFTAVDGPQPEGVPPDYVMKPYDIRLAYEGSHWLTVRFELGRDEIGSTEHIEMRLAQDIIDLFQELGLPTPEPLPVLVVEHQIAPKLHACTEVSAKTGRNERAHDLVDLQLLEEEEQINMVAVNTVATGLFVSRRSHTWPPEVRAYDGWEALYAEAADGLHVLAEVDEAVQWANDFIKRVVEAGQAASRGDGGGGGHGGDGGGSRGSDGDDAAADGDAGEAGAAAHGGGAPTAAAAGVMPARRVRRAARAAMAARLLGRAAPAARVLPRAVIPVRQPRRSRSRPSRLRLLALKGLRATAEDWWPSEADAMGSDAADG